METRRTALPRPLIRGRVFAVVGALTALAFVVACSGGPLPGSADHGAAPKATSDGGEQDMTMNHEPAGRLRRLMDDDWQWSLEQYPEMATHVGHPGYNDRWTSHSPEAIAMRQAHVRASLATLMEIDRKALPAADIINYDFYRHQLELDVAAQAFPEDLLPINQMSGVQNSLADTILLMPGETKADYEDILARLAGVPQVIQETMALLKRGVAAGVTVPKVTLRDVPDQIRAVMAPGGPLLQPFGDLPVTCSAVEQEELRARAEAVFSGKVRPAFAQLLSYLEKIYIPAARESIGLGDLPAGEAWYAHAVRESTSTNLSPEEIHRLGLAEVKRIRGRMDEVLAETGFTGGFQEFLEFLRTDPRFYFSDAGSLLTAYRDIVKRADPELMALFGRLPRMTYGVAAVPAYAEKSQTTAYYQPGSLAAGRPGIFYANTYDLASRPRWEMEALSLHEAVPGHHLQFALAQEMEDVPAIRRFAYLTAFSEGWGLYAESLGLEMGFYTDPYARFGQLTYEMWRAIRLVVDTGLHAMGWSRRQAIDYFAENAGKTEHDIVVEVDRYIVWPAQALAYKIGELKIRELRTYAQRELGTAFEIRAFHDALLAEGSLPLNILDERIHAWVAVQARGKESAR